MATVTRCADCGDESDGPAGIVCGRDLSEELGQPDGTTVCGGTTEPIPAYRLFARKVLAVPVGPTPIDTPDGPLIKCDGVWFAETVARPDVQAALKTAEQTGDVNLFESALGPHDTATLTFDGRLAATRNWCGCTPEPDAGAWIRYERYSARGREAHGYVCPTCRRLVQSG